MKGYLLLPLKCILSHSEQSHNDYSVPLLFMQEESEEEPKLKYERLSNGVTEILQKDAASCMTVHDKVMSTLRGLQMPNICVLAMARVLRTFWDCTRYWVRPPVHSWTRTVYIVIVRPWFHPLFSSSLWALDLPLLWCTLWLYALLFHSPAGLPFNAFCFRFCSHVNRSPVFTQHFSGNVCSAVFYHKLPPVSPLPPLAAEL